jgi:hypothetical protein
MRTDWVPFSASALVIGAMSLVLGAVLNPLTGQGGRAAATLRAAGESDTRWLGMSVMYFLASIFLTLGLPALLSLFVRRGRALGVLSVGVFSLGTIGLAGFAMLTVFLRTLVTGGMLRTENLDGLDEDLGLAIFLYGWIVGFYLGVLLISIALFVARKTPVWVPVLLVLFVAMMPVSSHLGRIGSALQVLTLAIAFTGVAVASVSDEHKGELRRQPVF